MCLGGKVAFLLDCDYFIPSLLSRCMSTGERGCLPERVQSFGHFRLQGVGSHQFRSGLWNSALLQQSVAQPVDGLGVSRLQLRFCAEGFFGLRPLGSTRIDETEFQMKLRHIWTLLDRLLKFLLRLGHLPEYVVILRHRLMRTRRVRIGC